MRLVVVNRHLVREQSAINVDLIQEIYPRSKKYPDGCTIWMANGGDYVEVDMLFDDLIDFLNEKP